MRRRDFITLLGGAIAISPGAAPAQRGSGRMAHIGIIDNSQAWDPFRQQLHDLQDIDGQNIAFDYRIAEGIPERLLAAATELAQIPVDVIAVFGTPAAQAAKRATRTIPIVAISIGDPIGAGLVSSLARPDGNVTANTILGPEVVTKRLQILKDALPFVSRVGLLWNSDNVSNAAIFDQLRQAVPSFHMTLISIEVRTEKDFDRAFAQMASDRPDAVLTTNDPLHQANMKPVIDFLLNNRIPGIFQIRKNVVDGGLMSYGVSFPNLFRRGAVYVDKILHGAKPQDLPVEQPVTFELIINLKTARAIGLDLPAILVGRADEVIE